MADRTCSVDGCPKAARNRGWCSAHYERWRRNGEPGPAGDARLRPAVPCSIDGCETVAKVRGWCPKHYSRYKAHGDPTATTRPTYGSGVVKHRDGYLLRWAPGHPLAMAHGYVLEHRYVVHEAGIAVPPGYHVHHLNHDKTDNRLENLAVMSPSAHQRHHVAPGSVIKNQYGTWTVATPEEQKERIQRARAKARRNARMRRDGIHYDHELNLWLLPVVPLSASDAEAAA